ncbi:MAG: TatD family hydrolase [Gammaproteobacteria bacterium]|nr:TatD family hydrolase [Gammaproteobacteria bacterium]
MLLQKNTNIFLVDSHCHLDQLDLSAYENNLSKALAFANENAVKHMLCVSITLKDFLPMLELIDSLPNVSASVGLHPNETDIEKEPTAEELIELANHPKVIAIGETGLDYYRSEGDLEWQRERFRQHIIASKKTQKPLIVHMRQATNDTLRILQEQQVVQGVMHCFTEDWTTAVAAMDLGFYISFSGIVTFSNAKLIQEVAKKMPLDRMLIETDSPYLAPVPFRGKTNQPAYVRYVAEYIAQLRNIPLIELAEQTTNNFFTLFKNAKYQQNVR